MGARAPESERRQEFKKEKMKWALELLRASAIAVHDERRPHAQAWTKSQVVFGSVQTVKETKRKK